MCADQADEFVNLGGTAGVNITLVPVFAGARVFYFHAYSIKSQQKKGDGAGDRWLVEYRNVRTPGRRQPAFAGSFCRWADTPFLGMEHTELILGGNNDENSNEKNRFRNIGRRAGGFLRSL